MFDLLIKNATVVTPQKAQLMSIAVTGEKISALLAPAETVSAKTVYDFSNCIIFPGLIDSHAHVTYCGDIASGSYTAASGGVTTLVEMPTSGWLPDIMNKHILESRIDTIHDSAAVDFALYGGISADNLYTISELSEAGVAAFKVFLSNAGSYGSFTDGDLQKLFRALRPYNGLTGIHAETESICSAETSTILQSGAGPEKHSASRPIVSELLAVSRLCALALHEHAKAHICHISSSEVVEIINYYRGKGAQLSAETCPHYLLLNENDVIRCGSYAKCSPPIRSQESVDALWECVVHGGIDIIGSDHATYSEKQKESGTFWEVPGGFPGLDLILTGLYTEGVLKRQLSLTRLAQITASNAARMFGLSYCKGTIEVGMDADFAVYDPNKSWRFHVADSFYNNKSPKYPYENYMFHGKVTHTFVRGTLVYENGSIVAPTAGTFIPAKHT